MSTTLPLIGTPAERTVLLQQAGGSAPCGSPHLTSHDRWRDSRLVPPDTLMQTVPRALPTPYADSLAPIWNPDGVGRHPGVSAQEHEIPQ